MNIQKAVIARAKMCETDLDRVTIILVTLYVHGRIYRSVGIPVSFNLVQLITQQHFTLIASNLVGR